MNYSDWVNYSALAMYQSTAGRICTRVPWGMVMMGVGARRRMEVDERQFHEGAVNSIIDVKTVVAAAPEIDAGKKADAVRNERPPRLAAHGTRKERGAPANRIEIMR